MKELSIEQKAKAYDEAKYIMKEYLESGNAGVIAENTIKKAFPELVESEDEKIRKELIKFVKVNIPDQERYIAWLEKQCEKKHDTNCFLSWSEEDEEIVEALNDYVKNLDILFSEIKIGDKDILSKEFREKVQLWLKSLRTRSQWKPSEEQLRELRCVISGCSFETPILVQLEEDLKKLLDN